MQGQPRRQPTAPEAPLPMQYPGPPNQQKAPLPMQYPGPPNQQMPSPFYPNQPMHQLAVQGNYPPPMHQLAVQGNYPPPTAPMHYPYYPIQPGAQYPPMGYATQYYAPRQNQQYTGDGDFAAGSFSDKQTRNNFVKKVYLILISQLLLTAAIVAICMFTPPIYTAVRSNPIPMYVAYAIFIVTYFTLVCCGNVRRTSPGNYIALLVFTLAFSYVTAAISCRYSTYSVLIALAMTTGCCVIITLFAVFGCIDLTKCVFLVIILSIGLMLMGIAVSVVYVVWGYNKVLHTVYASVASVIFMFYLAFDTQMLIGGRSVELSPEEYIYGAMQLYMDVVNLFLILLSLTGTQE